MAEDIPYFPMMTPKACKELRKAAVRAQEAVRARDDLIRSLHARGASLRVLADCTGTITHSAIARIVKRDPRST